MLHFLDSIPLSDSFAAVNGTWSNWGAWSKVSVTCGEGAYSLRTRQCTNPVPVSGGRFCPGPSINYKNVTLPHCREFCFGFCVQNFLQNRHTLGFASSYRDNINPKIESCFAISGESKNIIYVVCLQPLMEVGPLGLLGPSHQSPVEMVESTHVLEHAPTQSQPTKERVAMV